MKTKQPQKLTKKLKNEVALILSEKKKRRRKPYKLDSKKLICDLARGLSPVEAARNQNLNKVTVYSYLHAVGISVDELTSWRKNRIHYADVNEIKTDALIKKFLDCPPKIEQITTLTPLEHAKCISFLAKSSQVFHMTGRLERGQSTDNVALGLQVSEIMVSVYGITPKEEEKYGISFAKEANDTASKAETDDEAGI
jgi:hypothetical protein